jgi:hypothetical protein
VLLDPLSPTIYAAMAKCLHKSGDSTEAQRMARLAQEIDPNIVWEEPGLVKLLQ